MPFPQIAKDNLVVALTMANVFTDDRGQYPALRAQMEAIKELQRFIGWQTHHSYHLAVAGRSPSKKALSLYINLESSVDLFMRYMKIPACEVQGHLAYLDENVQKLIYNEFKNKVLRKSLSERLPPPLKTVKDELRNLVKEKVQGYATRPSTQAEADRAFASDEEWEIFVAEVNVGLESLATQYHGVLRTFHKEFFNFRKGQLDFIQNYFHRCLFLCKLEAWLNQVPADRDRPAADSAKVTAFCQKLLELEQNYNEFDLTEFNSQLLELQGKTLNQEQFKLIVTHLISLKPKYDVYCTGQDQLNAEEQVQQFMDTWPKPKLPRMVVLREDKADREWRALRDKQREQEAVKEQEEGLKRKIPAGKRLTHSPAA